VSTLSLHCCFPEECTHGLSCCEQIETNRNADQRSCLKWVHAPSQGKAEHHRLHQERVAEQVAWADRAAGSAPAAVTGSRPQLAASQRSSDTPAVVGRLAAAASPAIEQGHSAEAGGAAPEQLGAEAPPRTELPGQRGGREATVPETSSKQTPVHQRAAATTAQAAGAAAPCSGVGKTGGKHLAPPAKTALADPSTAAAHVQTDRHVPGVEASGSRPTVRLAEAARATAAPLRSDTAGRVHAAADTEPATANGAAKQAAVEEGSNSLRRQGSPQRCPTPQPVPTPPAAATPGSIPPVLPKHEHHDLCSGALIPVTDPRALDAGAPGANRHHRREPLRSGINTQQVGAPTRTSCHELPPAWPPCADNNKC